MKGNFVAKYGLKLNRHKIFVDKKHKLQYDRQRKHKKPLEDD